MHSPTFPTSPRAVIHTMIVSSALASALLLGLVPPGRGRTMLVAPIGLRLPGEAGAAL